MTEPGQYFRKASDLESETVTSTQRLYSCPCNEGTMTADFESRKLHHPSVNETPLSLSDVLPTFKVSAFVYDPCQGVLGFFSFFFFFP